jgi:hypothetical protein
MVLNIILRKVGEEDFECGVCGEKLKLQFWELGLGRKTLNVVYAASN